MWNSTAFSEKRSESRSTRSMQKYQYFKWGSTLNLDRFKIIIFQYIICKPMRNLAKIQMLLKHILPPPPPPPGQAGAPGKKFQGRQIDGEKRKNQWTLSNLFHFWYLNKKCCVPLFHNYDLLQELVISSWQMKKEVKVALHHTEHMWQIEFEWWNV